MNKSLLSFKHFTAHAQNKFRLLVLLFDLKINYSFLPISSLGPSIMDVSVRGGRVHHKGTWGSKLNRTSPKHKTSLIKTYFFCHPYVPHPIYF